MEEALQEERQTAKMAATSPLSTKVFEILDRLEDESRSSKLMMQLGVDTSFVQALRTFLKDPGEVFGTLSEFASRAFAPIFWEFLKNENLHQIIDSVGASVNGSNVSIWIFLKEKDYGFENRAKIYSLKANLVNNLPLFKKVKIDLLILKRGEAELPSSYAILPAA